MYAKRTFIEFEIGIAFSQHIRVGHGVWETVDDVIVGFENPIKNQSSEDRSTTHVVAF